MVEGTAGREPHQANILGSVSNLFHCAQRKNHLSRHLKPETDYMDRPANRKRRHVVVTTLSNHAPL